MSIVLKVLGILFLIVVLLVVVAFFYIRRKWRQIKNYALNDTPTPHEIHLNEDLNPEWIEEPEVAEALQTMAALGYEKGKAYTIKEMPQVTFISLFDTGQDGCGVISRHEQGFIWSEFCAEYADGSSLTVSNAPMGDELDTRPDAKKIIQKDADIAMLYELFQEALTTAPKVKIEDTNFRDEFEKSYKKDMEWRIQKGGTTEEEVRRIAQKGDMDLDEEDFEEAMIQIKLKEIHTWHDACLEHALNKKNVPKEKWEIYKDQLFIVSDRMFAPAFLQYLDDHMDFEDGQYESFEALAKKTGNAAELYAKIDVSLSPGLRAKRLGRTNYPITVEIFRRPVGI